MANISDLLNKIASAIYGRDMRTAIHDSIKSVNDEVNAHKSATILDHVDGSVTAAKIANNAVATDKIKNGAVTEEKIANNAVTVDKIKNGAVNETKLANNAVTVDKIKDGVISTPKIANEAITNEKIGDKSVTSDKIADGAVGGVNLKTATINELGGIKPYSKDGKTNSSGLIIYDDGATVVNTNSNYGTGRSGDGKIVLSAATTNEIEKGEQAYKPIVPKTFKPYKDKIDLIQVEPDKSLMGKGTIFPTTYTFDDPTESTEGIPGQIGLSTGGVPDEGQYKAFICTAAYTLFGDESSKVKYEWIPIEKIETNSNYGTGRSGDGKIVLSAATTSEIEKGEQAYKPIVPKTVKYAVSNALEKGVDTGHFNNVTFKFPTTSLAKAKDMYSTALYYDGRMGSINEWAEINGGAVLKITDGTGCSRYSITHTERIDLPDDFEQSNYYDGSNKSDFRIVVMLDLPSDTTKRTIISIFNGNTTVQQNGAYGIRIVSKQGVNGTSLVTSPYITKSGKMIICFSGSNASGDMLLTVRPLDDDLSNAGDELTATATLTSPAYIGDFKTESHYITQASETTPITVYAVSIECGNTESNKLDTEMIARMKNIMCLTDTYPAVPLDNENALNKLSEDDINALPTLRKSANTPIYYGVCNTDVKTAVKEVTTVNGNFELTEGAIVIVHLNKNMTAEPKDEICFNIDGTGEIPFYPNSIDGSRGIDFPTLCEGDNLALVYSQYNGLDSFSLIDGWNFEGVASWLSFSIPTGKMDTRYVTLEEVADGIDQALAPHEYSSTPQKIGKWIDDTPMWRVAFNHTLTELDAEDITSGGLDVVHFVQDCVKDMSVTTSVMNANVTFRYTDTPSVIDDQLLSVVENAVTISEKGWINYDDKNKPISGIYGYMDFATPTSNIKT